MNLAPRGYLLLCGGANVRRRDDRAQAAGGSDRLQAGNARAHDEDLGRRHGAGSGHHHRQRAVIFVGGVDHRLITGKVCLAGKHVHGLGAGDARHQLHGEGCEARAGHGRYRFLVTVRVHDGDDDSAGPVAGNLLRTRPTDLEDHVGGFRIRRRTDTRTGLLVFLIGYA